MFVISAATCPVCLFPFQVQQYLEEAQMEMEVELTAEDDPDKMKDMLAKLEVSERM